MVQLAGQVEPQEVKTWPLTVHNVSPRVRVAIPVHNDNYTREICEGPATSTGARDYFHQ